MKKERLIFGYSLRHWWIELKSSIGIETVDPSMRHITCSWWHRVRFFWLHLLGEIIGTRLHGRFGDRWRKFWRSMDHTIIYYKNGVKQNSGL